MRWRITCHIVGYSLSLKKNHFEGFFPQYMFRNTFEFDLLPWKFHKALSRDLNWAPVFISLQNEILKCILYLYVYQSNDVEKIFCTYHLNRSHQNWIICRCNKIRTELFYKRRVHAILTQNLYTYLSQTLFRWFFIARISNDKMLNTQFIP